jgi:co-chaperonin GroES (HSP10)
MKFPKHWLKDVIVVKFHDNGYKNANLILPSDIKHSEQLGQAEIVAIGSKFRYKDDVAIGDTVWVDTRMGTRRTYSDKGELVTYDWDDIYGKATI